MTSLEIKCGERNSLQIVMLFNVERAGFVTARGEKVGKKFLGVGGRMDFSKKNEKNVLFWWYLCMFGVLK